MKKAETYQLSLNEYRDLFKNLYKLLCLFANTYVKNIETSKDIVQNVFIKIWEDKVRFKNKTAIKSYLYTAVKNRSLDYLKSKRYKSTEYLSLATIERLEVNSFFMREEVVLEASAIIERAIGVLPNKCAEIIRLSAKDFSNDEIAKKLCISINTVKSQKKTAYKRLKPILKECFLPV